MTGRERLAKVLSRALTDADAWIESAEVPRLTDAALAHIAAVLRDDATAEAVQSDHWLIVTSDGEIVGCQCGYKASPDDCGYGDGVIEHILHEHLDILAERLGVPHVDR